MTTKYDVIVIGAGPAGSVTTRKCAQLGLKTLLLERKTLPRDKLCSGMVMGRLAHEIIAEEFGPIPDTVLTDPRHLLGYMLHAPGMESRVLEQKMPFAWRRDLDFWMAQQAKQAGAEVRDNAKVTSVEQRGDSCAVWLDKKRLDARAVVGADGARSMVRKQLYPDLRLEYRVTYRECYAGELSLDRNYFHLVFPLSRVRPRFDVNHKGQFFVLEGSLKELRSEVNKFLRPYGFSTEQRLSWKDGCLSGARIVSPPVSAPLVPAQGNVVLVGDAAMVQLPVTGEGIGTGLKSGLLAAHSIADALAAKRSVAEIYLSRIQNLLTTLRGLSTWDRKLAEANKAGAKALFTAFAEGFRATLDIS